MLLTLIFYKKPLSPTEKKVQNKLLVALYNTKDVEQDQAAEMTKKIIQIWHFPIFGIIEDENDGNKNIAQVKIRQLTHAYLHRIKGIPDKTLDENENQNAL